MSDFEDATLILREDIEKINNVILVSSASEERPLMVATRSASFLILTHTL